MWLGVDLRMDTKKDAFLEDIGLRAQNLLTILNSRINMVGRTYMTI